MLDREVSWTLALEKEGLGKSTAKWNPESNSSSRMEKT